MYLRDSKLSAELLQSIRGMREGSATRELQPVSTETPSVGQEQGANSPHTKVFIITDANFKKRSKDLLETDLQARRVSPFCIPVLRSTHNSFQAQKNQNI